MKNIEFTNTFTFAQETGVAYNKVFKVAAELPERERAPMYSDGEIVGYTLSFEGFRQLVEEFTEEYRNGIRELSW